MRLFWQIFDSIALFFKLARQKQKNMSLSLLAHNHKLAQRKNSRINYSHIGAVGDLPKVYFNEDEMNIANISAGGLLIIDDHSQLGNNVGNTIVLELKWDDYKAKIRSRIVGANLHRRHIQFVDHNSHVESRINKVVESALPGTKFYQAHTVLPGSSRTTLLQYDEIWLDSAGNSLQFIKSTEQGELAELMYNGKHTVFYVNKWPFEKTNKRNLTPNEVAELIVLIANFKNPTARIRYLVEKMNLISFRKKLQNVS